MLQLVSQKKAEVIKVIRTRLKMKGEGKEANDPFRLITQYWSLDGDLLAEEPDNWAEPKDVHCKSCGFLITAKEWRHCGPNKACENPGP